MKTTKTLEETHALASGFVSDLVKLSASDPKKSAVTATVVGLYGDLGSGKTSFVQGVAKTLGITVPVASPTFVLQKIYKLDEKIQNRFSHLVHIDAYRMDSADELAHIGWEEILKDPRNIICIEWPEKVFTGIPKDHIHVICLFVNNETRKFDIHF
ncbi:tRNA (adenosine(37)-N6)-threonylcarbamoyltransferase complex ATPase subunit type 1 TsaE [Candidatus Parcubacteria bacterium]|nr:tRNA (adenosine(37)-N6)-threonylcarbamoyltransferase complex ATPase subunit type 1 TsaE [Candidatus Parcubacteria bacterium]